MSTTQGSRELQEEDIVVRTDSRGPKLGRVRSIWHSTGEVVIQWATKPYALPRIRYWESVGRSVMMPKGQRHSGSCKPSTLRRYKLRRLSDEQVERLQEQMDEAEERSRWSFPEFDEARRLLAEAAEEGEPVELPFA